MDTISEDEYKSATFLNDNEHSEISSSAVLMDGQYLIPTNSKTILLQNDDTQYFIQNAGDLVFNCSNENTILDQNEILHLISNTENQVFEDDNQVIYFTNDMDLLPKTELTFMDVIEPSVKKEQPEFLDLESLIQAGGEIVENDGTNGFQYVVQLEDLNSLQMTQDVKLENIAEHSYNTRLVDPEDSVPIDISKITGKNLLTGQKVTLESYLQKVKSSSRELTLKSAENISETSKNTNEHTALSNLLNKKLTIGKTVNGQRLIGKVIHVGKKDFKDEEGLPEQTVDIHDESIVLDECEVDLNSAFYDAGESYVPNSVIIENNQNDDDVLLNNINEMMIFDKIENVSETIEIDGHSAEPETTEDRTIHNDMMEYVTKTMSNLMNMESILKKLKRKNLLIKVIEKVVTEDEAKTNTYHLGGHLEMLGGWQKREYEEKWTFKLDFEKGYEENEKWAEMWPRKFPETMKLTISIVKVDGLIHSTKVNLNYSLEKCNMCSKEFKSIYKLKNHMKLSHNVDYQYKCQICDQSLESKDVYNHHRMYHIDNKELFPCTHCNKHFLSEQKLSKHLLSHNLDTLKQSCTVCGANFDKISVWREHMLKHEGINKPVKLRVRTNDSNVDCQSKDVKNCYVCKVCNRTFSRYSNLQRHSEIHGTKNSMALYSCSMCGCTYNYISSLTRHIVQNHLSAT